MEARKVESRAPIYSFDVSMKTESASMASPPVDLTGSPVQPPVGLPASAPLVNSVFREGDGGFSLILESIPPPSVSFLSVPRTTPSAVIVKPVPRF